MSESFATLLDESLETLDMKQGSIVSGVVLDVDKDWVTVHVGLKSEGIISLDEFRDNDGNTDINVGDDVEVALEAVEDGYGETRISREKKQEKYRHGKCSKMHSKVENLLQEKFIIELKVDFLLR